MLTFKDNEKEIQKDFYFHVGAIKKLMQYKQIQDWLISTGFEYKKQDYLDLLLGQMIECLIKKTKEQMK